MISKIEVENIKGFGIPGKTINLNLSATKINLCIAPNGFGKSSLATAFGSLNRNKLDVTEDNKHYAHKDANSSLKVTLDGIDYEATSRSNDISPILKVFVIHNRTCVDYTKRVFARIVNVTAFTKIEEIVICNVPKSYVPSYRISKIKREFGHNGKILSSIEDLLSNVFFLETLSSIYNILIKYQAAIRKTIIKNITDSINSLAGNGEAVLNNINDDLFAEIESEPYYAEFLRTYSSIFEGKSKLYQFNVFYQILYLWDNERDNLKAIIERAKYERYRDRINANLQLLNTTGQSIEAIEKEGKLIIVFPLADTMSNGQRDVLTFAAELMIIKSSLRQDKKYLIIIDEVFDYLDDANTLAAQYYLSDIVKSNAGNIYIMLLTHLNPYTFRNYVFNPKMINEVYLSETQPLASVDVKSFIAFREWLNPSMYPDHQGLYNNMSRDLFHYNPYATDHSTEIESHRRPGVKSTWGEPTRFKTMLISELNKYLNNDPTYDPYAVAIALRLRVEKIMYSDLPNQAIKDAFVETHTTNKKLEFCENNGIIVSDAYFIVNSIHNSADHLKQNQITGIFEEKQMVYKLSNNVVYHIIAKLFCYEGLPITVDTII